MQIPFLDLYRINERQRTEITDAINQVIDSGWYIQGQANQAFCSNFAKFCGCKYVLGVANGLDALKLIIQGYGFGEGDEIIVPSNTFIASILAISQTGCTPILVEPDLMTYTIDPVLVEQAITSKTKAIMVVHLYGQVGPMEALWEISARYGLKLIEDAAQAHGALFNGKRTGNLADAAGFSFYPGKNLGCMGDGGAISTNNKELYERVKAIANYGSVKKYNHAYKGVNSRLDDIQAAILDVKLQNLDKDNERRRCIATYYCNAINNPLVELPKTTSPLEHVWHLFVVRTKKRIKLQQYLLEKGIQTQIHYPVPPHKQLAYKEMAGMSYPISEKIHNEVLSLPISPLLTDEEIDYIAGVVTEYK